MTCTANGHIRISTTLDAPCIPHTSPSMFGGFQLLLHQSATSSFIVELGLRLTLLALHNDFLARDSIVRDHC
jgi:hypothetical protein